MEDIRTVAVVGAGYMGGGIAQVIAMGGVRVALADVDADASQRALQRLIEESREFEEQGLFAAGSAERVEAHLSAAPSIEEAVREADFIEEAVPEVPHIKDEVLRRIEAAARPDAIIGSNTSTLPIADLAKSLTDPARFLGVHYSNPAPFIPGVELIAHDATSDAVLPVVEKLVSSGGKLTARVKDNAGFVLNRLQYALLKEAMNVVEDGIASAEDVDTVVRSTFGYRLPFFGPFAIADMAGLDVYAACFRTFESHYGERMATPQMLTDLVDAGKLGVKQGGGFVTTPEQSAELVAYRNKAYARLGQLLDELGPPPTA